MAMYYYDANGAKVPANGDELIQLATEGVVVAETTIEINEQQIPARQMKSLATVFAAQDAVNAAKAKLAKTFSSQIDYAVTLLRFWIFVALGVGLVASGVCFLEGPQFGIPALAYVVLTSAVSLVATSIIRSAAFAYGKAEAEKITLLKSIAKDIKNADIH